MAETSMGGVRIRFGETLWTAAALLGGVVPTLLYVLTHRES